MSISLTPIDLSQLPPPDVIETLDYESIYSALIADFRYRYPALAVALESDPVTKLLQNSAYQELMLRGRVNDAAHAVMLASAIGADLDQLGAWWGVARRILTPADPPTPEVLESDASYRAQIQASPSRLSSAGPRASYRWHALATDATLLDVGVSLLVPGTVLISVLAAAGAPTAAQLSAIVTALSNEDVRPLCDTVVVAAATLHAYTVNAVLHLGIGPSPAVVEAAARAAVLTYTAAQRRVGARIARSALLAALHQPGVEWVELSAPALDIEPANGSAPWPSAINLTSVAADE